MQKQTAQIIDFKRTKIVGKNEKLIETIELAKKIAAKDYAPILITGETGSGKELIADLIRNHSPRRAKPWQPINCASLSESLIESELFGHEKGSFTGANILHQGKIEVADSGTVFLDEVGDLSPGAQAKLLRFLENGSYFRVGGNKELTADVRIITATNKNLPELIKAGRFRSDLYYRINGVNINVPPLRERKNDIEMLAGYILHKLGEGVTFTRGAIGRLKKHDWPGNVRELESVINLACLMCDDGTIRPEDIRIQQKFNGARCMDLDLTMKEAVDNFKKEFITQVLLSLDGNRSKASKKMEIQRTYLSRLIGKYDIEV